MKCVICDGTGSKTPGETCLQSTPHGSVCSECIAQLVADVIQMRKPWDKAEWKRLELEDYEELYEQMSESNVFSTDYFLSNCGDDFDLMLITNPKPNKEVI